MRLFVAVQLPDEVKDGIERAFLLEIPPRKLKKVSKENLHITLFFIGEAPEDMAQEILGKINEIKFEPFTATIAGAGSFGGRVIWAGITQGAKELEELAKRVSDIFGIEQKFSAHITLARGKNMPSHEVREIAGKLEKAKDKFGFEVKSISLMESKLTPKGSVYTEVSESTFSKTDSGL